jgi:glycosyltransferase involved in cell wall biosynthesis
VDFERVDGIQPDAAGFRRKHGIPEHHAVVMQASWIIPEKGFADLLEAARLVLAEEPDVHFVMVGEGNWRARYTELAQQMGIGNRVIWTGLVENPLAEGVFAVADIVCQMSRWQEVFGWVIAEAMAYAKPLVATRVGGIPELIEEGRSGFLVSQGDTRAMADCLLRLLRDGELRQRFGVAGRQICESRFDLRRNVAEIIRLYGIDCTPVRVSNEEQGREQEADQCYSGELEG